MSNKIIPYFREFRSPEKVILVFLLVISLLIKTYHVWFYRKFCFSGEGLVNASCSSFVRDYLYTPLATVDNELIIFFVIIVLLPLTLLCSWFKYIASWSIPLGLLLAFSTSPERPSGITPNFTTASVLTMMVQLWIILLIGFLLFRVGSYAWNKHRVSSGK